MNRAPLRRDLQVLPLAGNRDCMVVDEIGGRFARIKRTVWEQLRGSQSGRRDPGCDRTRDSSPPSSGNTAEEASLWQQAAGAGWTETRAAGAGRAAWSPLSIRVPIGSIDAIACRIVPLSNLLFSPRAIAFWLLAALLGIGLLIVRWDHWRGSIPTLTVYLQSLHPLTIAVIFVLTKSVHELGHAVACRRLGSRCGVAGIWFLCFMPCPYVDVTEVWRQPNPMRRAAVMAAGMIAEGVLCVIAIWVWALADSAEVRLAAMNLILICGVSTVLFNANPLMRYDGYFILSDLVDSTNLRAEARLAWSRLLIEPWPRWRRLGTRTWALLLYHGAAAIYRVTLVIAIAAMLLGMADRVGAWRILATVLFLISLRIVADKLKGGWAMWQGDGKWARVTSFRRRGLAVLACLLLVAVLCIPTPRYRHVDGRLRAADVQAIYLPAEGTMAEVNVGVGDRVFAGQQLARLRDPELLMEIESSAGRARMLEHRARNARLASLQSPPRGSSTPRNDRSRNIASASSERQWDVLDAASRALATQQSELAARHSRLHVIAPAAGVVLPPDDEATGGPQAATDPVELTPGVGTPSNDRFAWCRIATSNRVQLSLPMNAKDHLDAQVGCPVRFTIPGYSSGFYRSEIASVSPLHSGASKQAGGQGQPIVSHADANGENHVYQAVCQVPESVALTLQSLPRWEGATCHVVVHLPSRALWEDLWKITRNVLGR